MRATGLVRLAVAVFGWLCVTGVMAADTDKPLAEGEGWLVVVVESGGLRMVRYYRSNRGLQAVMALDESHKGLRDAYAWRNDLPSPGPFIEFAMPRLTPEISSALQRRCVPA